MGWLGFSGGEIVPASAGLPQDALVDKSLSSAQISHLIGTTGSLANSTGRRRRRTGQFVPTAATRVS